MDCFLLKPSQTVRRASHGGTWWRRMNRKSGPRATPCTCTKSCPLPPVKGKKLPHPTTRGKKLPHLPAKEKYCPYPLAKGKNGLLKLYGASFCKMSIFYRLMLM